MSAQIERRIKNIGAEVSLRSKLYLVLFVALLLVGAGASAVILNVYESADDSATVEQQAVTYADSSVSETFKWDGASVRGNRMIEKISITNKVDVAAPVGINTVCNGVSSNASNLSFSGSCEGVDVKYADRFEDAGASPSGYSHPRCDSVYNATNVSGSFEESISSREVCFIPGKEYPGEIDIDEKGATVIGVPRGPNVPVVNASGQEYGFRISADNVTIMGFNITGDDTTESGVEVNTGTVDSPKADYNISVMYNSIHGMKNASGTLTDIENPVDFTNQTLWDLGIRAGESAVEKANNSLNKVTNDWLGQDANQLENKPVLSTGVRVYGNASVEDLEVSNNKIYDIGNKMTDPGTKYLDKLGWPLGVGISVENVSSAEISHNTIRNLKGGVIPNSSWGDVVYEEGEEYLKGSKGIVRRIILNQGIDEMTDFEVRSTGVAIGPYGSRYFLSPAPSSQNVTLIDNQFQKMGTGFATANYRNVNLSRNNFESTDADIVEASFLSANRIDAGGNWFGVNGKTVYGNANASWEKFNPSSISSGTSDTFGVIHDFGINVKPGDYNITMEVAAE